MLASFVALIAASSVAIAARQDQDRLPGANEARPQPRFEAYDVFIDAGDQRLAAYQVEIISPAAGVAFVGVEGGEHAAFNDPPFYDPRALQDGERIVLAAFSTDDQLPTGRTRIARLHVQEMPRPNDAPVDWAPTVIVAGDAQGQEIEVNIEVVRSNEAGGLAR